jgi:hypothetical protein
MDDPLHGVPVDSLHPSWPWLATDNYGQEDMSILFNARAFGETAKDVQSQ